jgi:tRNA pseudouridine13 synthase
VRLKSGDVLFYRDLDGRQRAELFEIELPLPSTRAELDEKRRLLYERVSAAEGLPLDKMKIRHPRGNFFSKGTRSATLEARAVSHRAEADELYSGKQKLTLSFDLPRGAYATMIVKRVTVATS